MPQINNELTILKEVNNINYPTYIFIMARYLISDIEAHDINGEYQLGLWEDPEEKGLITCITKSGKVCFLKWEDANELGVLDVQS